MILLLDTSILIDALRGRRGRRALLQQLSAAGHILAVSSVTIAELYGGMRVGEESKTDSVLASIDVYPVTRSIAKSAGLLKTTYARQGRTLGIVDMMIAATALEFDIALATDNVRDFPMKELKLFPLP